MSDLGPVGTLSRLSVRGLSAGTMFSTQRHARALPLGMGSGPCYLRVIHLGSVSELVAFAVRDATQGNPTAPSQLQARQGILKDIFWRVEAGPRTFAIDCLYGGGALKPRIRLRSNHALGVVEELIASAPNGAGWVTLTLNVTVSADGVLHIWRERVDPDLSMPLYWDNIVVS